MADGTTITRFVCQEHLKRYQKLLHTPLTELERQFIKRRIVEERQALQKAQKLARPRTALKTLGSTIILLALLPDLTGLAK